MKLMCSGRDIQTVFDLLGDKENDMTFGLGWVLANSEHFLAALLKDLTGRPREGVEHSLVKPQTGRAENGITDVEIELPGDLAVIFEAKRGAALPTTSQLEKYAEALTTTKASERLLVALTNATPAYATAALAGMGIHGVQLLDRKSVV